MHIHVKRAIGRLKKSRGDASRHEKRKADDPGAFDIASLYILWRGSMLASLARRVPGHQHRAARGPMRPLLPPALRRRGRPGTNPPNPGGTRRTLGAFARSMRTRSTAARRGCFTAFVGQRWAGSVSAGARTAPAVEDTSGAHRVAPGVVGRPPRTPGRRGRLLGRRGTLGGLHPRRPRAPAPRQWVPTPSVRRSCSPGPPAPSLKARQWTAGPTAPKDVLPSGWLSIVTSCLPDRGHVERPFEGGGHRPYRSPAAAFSRQASAVRT